MTESGWSGPIRLLEDAARMVTHSVTEVIPTEAQMHLLNAQRELLLAMALTIEHNSSRSVRAPRATKARTKKPAKRVSKVKIS